MALRVGNIAFDCDDVLGVARFWSAALDRPLDPHPSKEFASIGGGDPSRGELAWYFERVPEPKAAKNRVHLDLLPPDGEPRDELARLLRLGAVIAGDQPPGASWVILADPEGNEFCLEGGGSQERD